MTQKISNSVLITLIIVIGIFIFSAAAVVYLNSTVYAKTVSSTGISNIKVMPDLISVYFNIQTDGKTSSEASNKNSEITNEMKNSLLSIGFEEKEIQTQGFSIYPNHDWQSGTQKIKGYTATHSVVLKIALDRKEKIGKALDAGIDAGAGIRYINYELTDENQNKYKAEAIKKAAEDSRIKATAIADGAGQRIGEIVSISTDEFNYVPWLAVSESAAKESSADIATKITPSEQEISARVAAVFRMN